MPRDFFFGMVPSRTAGAASCRSWRMLGLTGSGSGAVCGKTLLALSLIKSSLVNLVVAMSLFLFADASRAGRRFGVLTVIAGGAATGVATD